MPEPDHSAGPRSTWVAKLSRNRVLNKIAAPFADCMAETSVRVIPPAATAITAKRIIQPRMFGSSTQAHYYLCIEPHASTCATKICSLLIRQKRGSPDLALLDTQTEILNLD